MARSRKQECLASLNVLIVQARQTGKTLPNDGTALCLGDILQAAELSWNHWRRYPELRSALETYAVEHNLLCSRQGRVEDAEIPESHHDPDLVPAKLLRDVQRRLADSERRCAELRAENAALRAKIARMPHLDALVAKGGRFTP